MTLCTTFGSWSGAEAVPLIVEAIGLQTTLSNADAEARALAAAVGRAEEGAFRQLYDRYHQRLFRLVLLLARGDEMLAQDTAQAVWVTAAAKLRGVESEAHLWNWLARVARQHLAKAWRQQRRDSAVVGLADLPERAEADQSDALLEEHLDAALQAIEGEERALIEWFYFDGLSQKEIAIQLNLTPKAVSSRLERARAKLRAAIARQLSHET